MCRTVSSSASRSAYAVVGVSSSQVPDGLSNSTGRVGDSRSITVGDYYWLFTAWREYRRGGVGGDRSATHDLPWAVRSGNPRRMQRWPVADRDGPADEGRLWPGGAAAASL